MPATEFNCQPLLIGSDLRLEPLKEADLEPLYAAARDPEIWTGHPAKERYKRIEFETYFDTLLLSKKALAVYETTTGRMIGTSSFYTPPDLPECMAIGFTFLIREKWGGTTNFELKQLMLDHAFTCFDEVWLHIAPSNIRSQKATKKLGAVLRYEAELKISAVPALAQCYSLTKKAWERSQGRACRRSHSTWPPKISVEL